MCNNYADFSDSQVIAELELALARSSGAAARECLEKLDVITKEQLVQKFLSELDRLEDIRATFTNLLKDLNIEVERREKLLHLIQYL